MTRTLHSAILVIGNEILSGRTQDLNVRHLATRLGARGLPVREVRVIPDVADVIVDTVSTMRAAFDLLFTTGGIGPTHDDITSECVARAFGVGWVPHAETVALMAADYERRGIDFNEARMRMATLPVGATPIRNPVSTAPGFSIANVHVMAGIPSVMRAMFEVLEPTLPEGAPVLSRAVHARGVMEGMLAAPLKSIADRYPALDLGSYPFRDEDGPSVAVVAKGREAAMLDEAIARVGEMLVSLGATPVPGEAPGR